MGSNCFPTSPTQQSETVRMSNPSWPSSNLSRNPLFPHRPRGSISHLTLVGQEKRRWQTCCRRRSCSNSTIAPSWLVHCKTGRLNPPDRTREWCCRCNSYIYRSEKIPGFDLYCRNPQRQQWRYRSIAVRKMEDRSRPWLGQIWLERQARGCQM